MLSRYIIEKKTSTAYPPKFVALKYWKKLSQSDLQMIGMLKQQPHVEVHFRKTKLNPGEQLNLNWEFGASFLYWVDFKRVKVKLKFQKDQ